MTPEERQLLGGLFDRIRDAAQGQQRDVEAEAFINNAIKAQPYAPYLLAQTVIVQEETMKGAVEKIEELEAKVRELEARSAAPTQQPQQDGGFLGGIGRSMFGGGEPPRPAPGPGAPAAGMGGMGMGMAAGRSSGVPSTSGISVPPPPGGQGMAPGMGAGPMGGQQPGPWQQPQQQGGGSSFLKGALGAAAGVAGGMLLANAVSGMFRGDSASAAGSGFGQKSGGGENVASSMDKGSPWGESKGGSSGDDWDNSGKTSGDDWGSSRGSSGGGDNWDNSSSVSGDDWDTSGSSGDDFGGGDE